jgi:hypothetical protein
MHTLSAKAGFTYGSVERPYLPMELHPNQSKLLPSKLLPSRMSMTFMRRLGYLFSAPLLLVPPCVHTACFRASFAQRPRARWNIAPMLRIENPQPTQPLCVLVGLSQVVGVLREEGAAFCYTRFSPGHSPFILGRDAEPQRPETTIKLSFQPCFKHGGRITSTPVTSGSIFVNLIHK